jgi:hypothetical protein
MHNQGEGALVSLQKKLDWNQLPLQSKAVVES